MSTSGFTAAPKRLGGFFCLAILTISCERPERAKVAAPPPLPSQEITIPVFRKLSNQFGKTIEVNIVGRTNGEIYTVRAKDNFKSKVPISSLSLEDQQFAFSLPIVPPPSDFLRDGPIPERKDTDVNELYMENRRKEIERLTDRNRELNADLPNTPNRIEYRSKESEIKRNNLEIERLETQIRSRKAQN